MNDFLQLVASRQSDRAYDMSRAVEPEKLERILEAARLSPSACNAQPWRFVVITDPELSVKVGKATIYTVLEDETVEEFEIEITKINENSEIKNISFEITDEELLNVTGGVIQGMSGSPIVQNGKLIGAVTHVVTDNVTTGYGLFITTMLEESEK